MSAKVDANLSTKTARLKLPVALDHKPYFRSIEPCLALGYRKLAADKPGLWIVRRRDGKKYTVKNLRASDGSVVIADDYSDPDGDHVLDFAQAQKAATGPRQTSGRGGFPVAEAVALYLAHLRNDSRTAMAIQNAEYVLRKHVLGTDIANAKVAGLSKDRLEAWRNQMIGDVTDPELLRRKKATVNRTMTTLKALLNFAVKEGKCEAGAWHGIGRYKKVEKARERFLSVEEAQRLIEHCDADLKPLVQAALGTGCRYGELAALEVRDYDARSNTLKIRQSKTGHSRTLRLSDESGALFRLTSNARNGSERMFTRQGGLPWNPCATRPGRSVRQLKPPVLVATLCFTPPGTHGRALRS